MADPFQIKFPIIWVIFQLVHIPAGEATKNVNDTVIALK